MGRWGGAAAAGVAGLAAALCGALVGATGVRDGAGADEGGGA